MNTWVWLLLALVSLLACTVALIWVPLPRPFPPPLSRGRNLVAAILTGVVGIGCLAALTVYTLSTVGGAGRALDDTCASLGLAPQRYMVFGRQYRGMVGGRQVDVRFMPARGTAPAALDIYVSADVGTRVAVGRRVPLLDCRGCARLDPAPPALAHLTILAEDEEAARRLLALPAAREAIGRLLPDPASPGESGATLELYVQPDRIWFRGHTRRIADAQFRQWVDDLLALAEAGN